MELPWSRKGRGARRIATAALAGLGLAAGLGLPAGQGGPAEAAEPGEGAIRYTITGDVGRGKLGTSVAALGDVDGDGVADFAVGVPGADSLGGVDIPGHVRIISGRDGTELRRLHPVEPTSHYGRHVVNAGKLAGDRIDDVLVSNFYALELRSSATGDLLGSLRLEGRPIVRAAGADLDGEGIADLILTREGAEEWEPWSLEARSGRTLETIWTRTGSRPDGQFGGRVVWVEDLDGDSRRDLAVSEAGDPYGSPGEVHFLRGRDGLRFRTWTGERPGDWFGAGLALLSDVDGDGWRDLAVGSPGHAIRGLSWAGKIELRSLRTGEVLWTQLGHNGDRTVFDEFFYGEALGSGLSPAGDADGDGLEDLLAHSLRVGFGGSDFGIVHLLSGRTGEILSVYEGERDSISFGWSHDPLGDIDGDGRAEFLVGAPEYRGRGATDPSDVGRAYVLGYRPEARRLLRGDADQDGRITISDAILTILHVLDGAPVPCEEALDLNRDHSVGGGDAAILLFYLFDGGLSPQPPFPACGRLESPRPSLPCDWTLCD